MRVPRLSPSILSEEAWWPGVPTSAGPSSVLCLTLPGPGNLQPDPMAAGFSITRVFLSPSAPAIVRLIYVVRSGRSGCGDCLGWPQEGWYSSRRRRPTLLLFFSMIASSVYQR